MTLMVSPQLHQQIEQAARAHFVRPGEYVRGILAERVKGDGHTSKREVSK